MDRETYLFAKELLAAIWLAACVTFAAPCGEPAETAAPQASETLEQAWMKVFQRHAEDYTIHPSGRPDEPFKLVAAPVFRHDAPSRNSDDIGGVWVWTEEDGRPAAIGTIFGWTIGPNRRAVTHEFHTLSAEPIHASWRNRDRWIPPEGVRYRPIPDAAVPASAAAKRRLQVRRLARRFSAYTIDHRGNRWQLRLVPSPVYSWEHEKAGQNLGGAVFVICQDTNTDVVLCIEVQATEDGARFAYACGSFADWEAHVELDGKEVWTAPNDRTGPRGLTSPHWVRRVPPEQLPTP